LTPIELVIIIGVIVLVPTPGAHEQRHRAQ
jgi:hypothetical protein